MPSEFEDLIVKTLERLGGRSSLNSLARALLTPRRNLYRVLKRLKESGVVRMKCWEVMTRRGKDLECEIELIRRGA